MCDLIAEVSSGKCTYVGLDHGHVGGEDLVGGGLAERLRHLGRVAVAVLPAGKLLAEALGHGGVRLLVAEVRQRVAALHDCGPEQACRGKEKKKWRFRTYVVCLRIAWLANGSRHSPLLALLRV